MRMSGAFIAIPSLIALVACSGSGDDSGQSYHGQPGPCISGSSGVRF